MLYRAVLMDFAEPRIDLYRNSLRGHDSSRRTAARESVGEMKEVVRRQRSC